MRLGRREIGLLALAALCACTGGQSGTETPAPGGSGGMPSFPEPDSGFETTLAAPHCACAFPERSALVHARLLELSACRVRATVEAVLAAAPGLTLELDAGTELDVERDTELGCSGEGLQLGAGDEVLIVYAPAQDGDFPTPGAALVASWGSVHSFGTQGEGGAEIALPAAERERLLDANACTNWFAQHAPDGDPGAANPDPGGGAACSGALTTP